MTESEVTALLDAHDALVKAYLDASLTFDVFVSAYDGFPHNYALDGHGAVNEEERAILPRFRKRVAFHVRVSGVLAKVCSENPNCADQDHRDADQGADDAHGDIEYGPHLPCTRLYQVANLKYRQDKPLPV
jgi:hypothetical protein